MGQSTWGERIANSIHNMNGTGEEDRQNIFGVDVDTDTDSDADDDIFAERDDIFSDGAAHQHRTREQQVIVDRLISVLQQKYDYLERQREEIIFELAEGF